MAVIKINLSILFLYHLVLLNQAYSKCPRSFQCGNLGSLEFPLSRAGDPECGLFMVDQCDSENPRIQFGAEARHYNLVRNESPNSFFIRDPALQELLQQPTRCFSFRDISMPKSPHSLFTVLPNLTLFTCFNQPYSTRFKQQFEGYLERDCPPFSLYYQNSTTGGSDPEDIADIQECTKAQLPLNSSTGQNLSNPFDHITAEFIIQWNVTPGCYNCHHGGGQCATNTMNEFICKKRGSSRWRLILGGGIIAALISTFIIVIHFIRRNYSLHRLFGCREAKLENERNIELFLKNNGNLVPLRYRYVDIKKMTKSFSENLGKGGYGNVYKGKLVDGRLVAVKILNESKENGEEFMNEVASISRTSHINIVTLLGFCFEGCKRALIYEFMPNGSLEKFIQNTAGDGLGWEKLFEISLGIARGLEYLHQGCKTRILHFDIKPHNILLDKDFNPRISDFGLAKMCPNRSSIVSMMVARGTIGYIAPEVFCRNFGEVSHKSDVYSYGMMVLEIAGGKKNIDRAEVDHTSEVYFPHYIYKQLEMDDAVSDGEIKNGDERQLAKRKLIIVGLWCIQTDPKERPSMTKVVEMLEGNLESLQLPPKPYISSPQDQHLIMFSTSETRNNVGLVC